MLRFTKNLLLLVKITQCSISQKYSRHILNHYFADQRVSEQVMYVVAFLNFEFHKNQKYAQPIVKRFCDEGHSLTLFGECSVCVWFCWWRGLKFCCELLLSSLKLRSMKVSQKHKAMTSTCYRWSGLLSRRRFNKKRLCFVQFRRFIYNRPPACAQNYFQKPSLGKTGDGSWTYIFRVSIFHTFIIFSVQKQDRKSVV